VVDFRAALIVMLRRADIVVVVVAVITWDVLDNIIDEADDDEDVNKNNIMMDGWMDGTFVCLLKLALSYFSIYTITYFRN
jgi:hypothetical protein